MFCASKNIIKKVKRVFKKYEKIFVKHTSAKGPISRIYK